MKNLKKVSLAILLMILGVFNLNAQTSVWKIEGKETTLYLGGTIHILRPGDYPLPAEFDSAYSKANTIVLEADLKELEDSASAALLMTKSMYPSKGGLSKSLSKSTYIRLKAELAKYGLPIESLEPYKPSMVLLTLTMFKMKELGISEDGVDKHFYEKAEADKKSLRFLETAQQQIKLITEMGNGNEDSMVLHTLNELQTMKKDLQGMFSDWKYGKSETLDRQMDSMKLEYPGLYQSMLVDRNEAWEPKLEEYLDNKNVEFVLVGSMHLHGPDGLLAYMKKRGYAVTQLETK